MRVVILYNTSWYVYLLRRNLISALLRAGCDVTVVAPVDSYTPRLINLGVSHVPIPLNPGSTSPLTEARTLAAIMRTLRSLAPDAVLSFTIKCNLYAGLCRRRMSFTQIANISGLGSAFERRGLSLQAIKSLYRSALKHTDHVFFQNRDDLTHCAGGGLISPHRAKLIPGSGVDLDSFSPSPRGHRSPRTFLMFGRLLPQKGYDHFLNAARVLRSEFGDRAAFWVLGRPDTSRVESLNLLERIHQAHAEGFIRYLNSSDDVRPFLRDADVAVLPSTYNEGIPRSLLEAMATGKAIITTDWRGCRETVHNGRNGYLVPPNDGHSLVTAMRELIECSEATLDSFSKASRERAETHFDERVVIQSYLQALNLSSEQNLYETTVRATGTHA